MSLQVERLEGNMAKLTVEVSAEEFEKAVQSAYMKQKKNINMPGFRKGKVPRKMLEKMYGAEIFYDDAANAILPGAYSSAAEESGLEITSQPRIDITQIESGKPFVFTAEVAVKPEVTLGEYKGLEIDGYSTLVSEEEINAEIEKEQQKNARTIVVEDRAVEDGDEIVLDFDGSVDGVPFEGGKAENYTLTIGSGSFIPGFEEQLIGAESGSDVDVKVTFPEDYHAEELQGKEAVFKCTVHEIKTKELPEIDDEFAAEVSEFDTLDEYKADIRAKLTEQKESEGKRRQEDQVVEKAIENAQMDIPELMLDTQVDRMKTEFVQRIQSQGISLEQYMMFTGITEEKMLEELRSQAEQRIRTRLVLEAIAKAENIEVSDERVNEEVQKMAEAYDMEADKLIEYMGEEEKEQMKEDIAVQEAITFLKDNAVEK